MEIVGRLRFCGFRKGKERQIERRRLEKIKSGNRWVGGRNIEEGGRGER
jgi:hypothetical protein